MEGSFFKVLNNLKTEMQLTQYIITLEFLIHPILLGAIRFYDQ